MSSCEKFDLDKRTWKNLPKMNETRETFNPCLFNGYIYLCGCSDTIEAFSPETDAFLPFRIPFPERSLCCLYEDEGLLVVRSFDYLVKFAAGRRGQLGQPRTTQVEGMNVYQSSQPVVFQDCVHMVQGKACVSFDKETGAVGETVHCEIEEEEEEEEEEFMI